MSMNYQGPGIYRHYKGNLYDVIGLAVDESTGREIQVIYRPIVESSGYSHTSTRPINGVETPTEFWRRPLIVFNDTITRLTGERMANVVDEFVDTPRFELVTAKAFRSEVLPWYPEIWLVVSTTGSEGVRRMDHEGDYDDGDLLLCVSVDRGEVQTRLVVTKESSE